MHNPPNVQRIGNCHFNLASGPITKFLVAAICTAFSTGCVTTQGGNNVVKETFASDDPCSNNARNIGIVAGGVLGAIFEKKVLGHKGAPVAGAVIGGAIGGLIGADIDNRRCELAKIAKDHGLEMVVEKIEPQSLTTTSSHVATNGQVGEQGQADNAVGLRVAIVDQGRQFQSGSATPTPQAASYFREIADKYLFRYPPNADAGARGEIDRRNSSMRILLVGHTDDTGSSRINADLSEQRARAVAKIFQEKGISAKQLFFQGAGETLPIADNREEAGRARNRRVEITDLSDEAAFRAYLNSRKPTIAYYRPSSATAAHNATATSNTVNTPTNSTVPSTPGMASQQSRAQARTQAVKPVQKTGAKSGTTTPSPGSAPSSSTARIDSPAAPIIPAILGIDFGGQPVGKNFHAVDIGKLSPGKSFSIISTAHASDESPVGSCMQDRPRISHGVKSLSDGKEYSTAEYLPGVYDTSWAGVVNGHLVALTRVAVLRDGGSPARKPGLLIYRDYKGDKNAKPDHSGNPEVNTYRGEKALLYRVFGSGPVRCLDIVIPNTKPDEAPNSTLYYDRTQVVHSASYAPKLAK